jgi:endonuclease/exonuclease/phosphatase family metal-dependent hydrolase
LGDLQDADVLILNEADWGMKRTEYRDVARELAAALHMNYAYGVEFVEVDPVFELGTEQIHLPDVKEDARLQLALQVDRERYRGLHGTAILSRYPILSARIVRLPVCYDWYGKEVEEAAKLEKGRRWAAHRLFKQRIEREVRHGGRMALIAGLAIPELPAGQATIVATHLENKCEPACRRRQMEALLAEVKQEKNPVVLAGDLNTTGQNNTPTSLRNEITRRVTDYKFWVGQAVSHFNPLGIYQYAIVPLHYFHGYNDPTALHVPILWDNRERPLFKTVENVRFADEGGFDFRGDPDKTLQRRSRTLADSNERGGKGFVPTYAFSRDYAGLVGRFKLDWFFVKPFAQHPSLKGQSNVFAPHFPQTMRELNESVEDRISDHPPMTVDLPLSRLN